LRGLAADMGQLRLRTDLEYVQTLCKRKDEYMKAFEKTVQKSKETQATAKRKAAMEIASEDDDEEQRVQTKTNSIQPKKRPLQTPPKKRNRMRRKTVEEELYTPRISEESTYPPPSQF
jgi:hypothetical protein